MSSHLNALAESETEGKDGTSPALNQAPLVNFSGHKDEGYAIDWSPATAGRLLSGKICHQYTDSYMLSNIVSVFIYFSTPVRGLHEYDSSVGTSFWFMDC